MILALRVLRPSLVLPGSSSSRGRRASGSPHRAQTLRTGPCLRSGAFETTCSLRPRPPKLPGVKSEAVEPLPRGFRCERRSCLETRGGGLACSLRTIHSPPWRSVHDTHGESDGYRISANPRRNPGSTGSADTLSGASRCSTGADGAVGWEWAGGPRSFSLSSLVRPTGARYGEVGFG